MIPQDIQDKSKEYAEEAWDSRAENRAIRVLASSLDYQKGAMDERTQAMAFAVWTQNESWNYSPFYQEWLHRGEYAPKTTEELYEMFLNPNK